ncbi:hypothetical protein EV1_009131 [Malus domestica]
MDAFSSSFLSTFPTQKISISHAITSPKLSSISAVRIEERPTSQPPASRPPPPPPEKHSTASVRGEDRSCTSKQRFNFHCGKTYSCVM